MQPVLITSLSIVLLLAGGLICLKWAPNITEFYRRHYNSHRLLKSKIMFPLRAWVESRYYPIQIRVCGVFMILLSLFLCFVMFRGLFN